MQDAVVKEVVLTEDDDRCERGMEGVWRACCINHDVLFARCAFHRAIPSLNPAAVHTTQRPLCGGGGAGG